MLGHRILIFSLLALAACEIKPLTAQQQLVLLSLNDDYAFHPVDVAQTPVYNAFVPPVEVNYEHDYVTEMARSVPPPTPAQNLLKCGQTSTCAGAFAIQ